MKENRKLARELISKSFGATEMAYLQQHAEFESAFLAAANLDDFESAVRLGNDLLFRRGEIQWSNPALESFHQ